MAEIPVFVRIKGAVDGSLNATIGKAKGEVKRLTAEVVDTGSQIGLFFGGASAGVLAIGAAALRTAGQFEQMSAKLQALLKDGEAAQASLTQAAALATLTPFSVEGLVNATVQLTAYGQRARAILPQVADLAAGMGKSVEEASLAVGKAASGSSEGYQSLRDTFGLTTLELKKLGVELNDSGGPLLRTSEQIERARQAMLKLIETKFGGAAAAQSKTFEGAVSNLGDAVQLAMNKVGQSILPIGTFLAKFTADFVGRFEQLPGPIVAVGVAVGGLAAGITALISAAALAGAAMVTWYSSLQAASASSTVAKATVDRLSTSYVTLSGAINTAATSQTRMAVGARTAGAGLAVATGVYIAGSIAIKAYSDAMTEAGEAVKQAATKSVNASNQWKLYRNEINAAAAASGVMVERGGRLGETAEQIREAFQNVDSSTLVGNLEKAGVSLDDIRRTVGQVSDELEVAQKKFAQISQVANRIPAEANGATAVGARDFGVSDFFPGRVTVTIDEIREKVGQVKHEMLELARTKEAVTQTLGVFERFAAPLQAAIDHAKRLDTFLQFTKSSKDIETLQTRIRETTSELRAFESAARAQGLPTQAAALQRELLTATGTRADFVKSYLQVIEQQGDAERDLAVQIQVAEQTKLAAIERSQSQARAFREVSLTDEKRFAEERLSAVTGSVTKEAQIVKELESVRAVKKSTPDLAGVDQRIRQLELELDGVRKLADEEVRARTEVRDATKKLSEEKVASARQAIQDQMDAVRELSSQLKTGEGDNVSAVSGQLSLILVRLDQWEKKNRSLVASSREVRRALEQARQAVEAQQAQIRDRVQAQRLEDIRQRVTLEVAEAPDNAAKLSSVKGAIAQINAEQKRGLLDAEAAKKALNDLTRQELALEKAINGEVATKAATLAGITQGSLEKEVEHLKVRQEAGENVAKQLAAKEKELLTAKVAAIEAAAEADRASNKDREIVEAERSAKLRALLLDETNAKIQANRQALDAINADNQTRGKTKGANIGTGLNTPGTISEQGYSSGVAGSAFSLGQRETSRSSPRVKIPTPQQIGAQMGLQSDAQARYEKLSSQGFSVAKPLSKDEQQQMTQTVNDNRKVDVAISLEGGSFASVTASADFAAAVLKVVEDKFRDEGWRDGGAGWL